MDWSKVKKVPEYNPYTFLLARHVRGWTKSDLSKKCKLPVATISKIENGEREPTLEEVIAIASEHAAHFPITFFRKWYETEIKFDGCLAKNIPINYYKYKVFRDLNPPPSMQIV